jgi:protein-disulfide isomerase
MENNRATIISLLIAAVLIGGALVYAGLSSGNRTGQGGAAAGQSSTHSAAAPTSANEPYLGSPHAPLTLYYWRDFQCPFCAKFDTQTLPALVSEYVNTGKLRVVFKDFVFLGPDSETAAEMSRAVWASASSSYDQWQQSIYASQGKENSGWASEQNLLTITATIPGVDVNKVIALMNENSSTYRTAANTDYVEGQQFGISATPGFWINGQSFSGDQPLAFFQQVINADLTK